MRIYRSIIVGLLAILCGPVLAGCASSRSAVGMGGGAAVSGEDTATAATTGAATDSPATNGSDTTGEAVPTRAKPAKPFTSEP